MDKGNKSEYNASSLNAMKSSEGWNYLEGVIDKQISYLYKQILKAKTFEEVLEARAQIKCYQKIKGEVNWADTWSDDKREPLNG